MVPSCVVLTSITHPSTHIARCQVYGHVKVAAVSVPMALALWGEGEQRPLEDHFLRVKEHLDCCHRQEFVGGWQFKDFKASTSY